MNQQVNGADYEIKFWEGFVKTDRFINGWVADIKTPELNQEVADFIKDNIPMHGSILDCGSGVVSILNGLLPKNYSLISADLLGEEYETIFDYKVHGLIAPLPVGAEALTFEDQFDIVHMSNALDHCQDPAVAYGKLLAAVKPGGYLILQGFENEADHEKWQGMHQWNILLTSSASDATLSVIGKDGRNFYKSNPVVANKIELPNGKSWFIFIVKK